MKVLHCCLAAFYIDNYGYQENILPKMHALQGHEVRIIASTETYLSNKTLGYVSPKKYYTSEGLPITRIPYIKFLPHALSRKLRIYNGLGELLEEFKPDIIFLHDVQFLSIRTIVKYARLHKVKIYADCHTDFINSARNWISKNILHKIIYKWCARLIEPYTQKFYGVLPLRVDFLKDVYNIPESKLDLLVLGADDSQFDLKDKVRIRSEIRKNYSIAEDDFVLVTGGKIDRRKNIHLLLEAFRCISNNRIKLILFGSITDDLKTEIDPFRNEKNVIFIDWLQPQKIYEILMASDMGIFPGTHSVLWEQSIGVGLPCVFKRWEGMEHVDLKGNCLFLEDVSVNSIRTTIDMVYNDKDLFKKMSDVAQINGIPAFTYSKIAKYAIEQ